MTRRNLVLGSPARARHGRARRRYVRRRTPRPSSRPRRSSTALGEPSDVAARSGLSCSASSPAVFILIALYVGAVVIVNAVDTVISGRLRHIALLRLLGARGRELRSSVMRGTASGRGRRARAGLHPRGTGLTHPSGPCSCTAGPCRRRPTRGSGQLLGRVRGDRPLGDGRRLGGVARSCCGVSPAVALAGTAAHNPAPHRSSVVRALLTGVGIIGGLLVLALGAVLGESNPGAGFVLAFLGAAGSGTGFLIGARFVIPRVVATFSRTARQRPGQRRRPAQRAPGPAADHALDDGSRHRRRARDDLRLGDVGPAGQRRVVGDGRGSAGRGRARPGA